MSNTQDNDLDDELLSDILNDFKQPPPPPPQFSTSITDSKDTNALTGESKDTTEEKDEEAAFLSFMEKEMEQLFGDLVLEQQMNDSWAQAQKEEPPESATLQEKIKSTVDRLKESSEELKNTTASSTGMGGIPGLAGMGGMPGLNGDELKMFEEMLKEMEKLGGGEARDGGEDLEQWMSKELLFEPMQALAEKYPAWLEKNANSLKPEEAERYRKQCGNIQNLLNQLHPKSEAEFKSLSETLERPEVVSLMEKIHDCGPPPPDLIKELAPDLGADEEARLNSDCKMM